MIRGLLRLRRVEHRHRCFVETEVLDVPDDADDLARSRSADLLLLFVGIRR